MQNEVPEVPDVDSVPDIEIIGCPKDHLKMMVVHRGDEPPQCCASAVKQ